MNMKDVADFALKFNLPYQLVLRMFNDFNKSDGSSSSDAKRRTFKDGIEREVSPGAHFKGLQGFTDRLNNESIFDKIGSKVSDVASDPEQLEKWFSLITTVGPIAAKVLSDEDMKVVSDLKTKVSPQAYIKHILESGTKLEPRHIKVMLKAFKHPNNKVHNEEAHAWRDDVLNDYMEHIKNYKYHYKDEAHKLDPSIDPNEQHIGPMAQDIEKVNPAAVKQDPTSGYKTVDTGRLALMNAGAIAELAREISDIKRRLEK